MNRYILYLFILIVASCQPEKEPEDELLTPEPVFYARGLVNGEPINLQAGIGNYYMDASVRTDSGVTVFTGNLQNKDCSSCGPSLRFTMRNYTSGTAYSIDSALQPQLYEYYDPTVTFKTYYDAEFVSQSQGSGSKTSEWDFGNGETFSGDVLKRRFNETGVYTVTHRNVFSSGCNSEIGQQVHIPSAMNGAYFDFNINYLGDTGILFNTLPVDETADVTWDFGDGTTGTGSITRHDYDTPGTYKVCVLIDQAPDDIRHCKNVNTQNHTACISNFSYKVTTVNDSLQLSNVVVEWRDEGGRLYTSSGLKQPATAAFRIIEKSAYEPNEKGERTMKVKVKFTCQVSDGTRTIELKDIEAVIALAYR